MRNDHAQKSFADVSWAATAAKAASSRDHDSLRRVAEQVADCFAGSGCAFVEEADIDVLAAMLVSFLDVAGIPVHPAGDGEPAWTWPHAAP